jgi:hypothetical protein
MRYCQRCGVPRILTSEHRWLPNGTITLARDATHRMVFIDNNALNYILVSVAGLAGIPLDDIIVEAKRKSGKHFMDALFSGLKGTVARSLLSKKVYEQLSKQISMLGLGAAEVSDYRKHSFLEGSIADGYSGPGITGDILGAFESVEGLRARADFEVGVDGTVGCRIVASDGGPEDLDKSLYEPPPALPGRNIYELCPICKAPLSLGASHSFDMDRGIIVDKKTGHRVVLIGVIALASMFGELERELGGEIPRMIMEIEKDRVKDIILSKGRDRETSEAGYLRYMKTLELRGMGNGSAVDARVDNPYYEPLIAGFLAGFYEATTGERAVVQWTGGGAGYTDITLRPA